MIKVAMGVIALCGAVVPGCASPTDWAGTPNPVEVVVNDGDTVPNLAPPQTLTVCYPGADGYDDSWVRNEIALGGGTFVLRDGVACGTEMDY